jgi:hypothetical protein
VQVSPLRFDPQRFHCHLAARCMTLAAATAATAAAAAAVMCRVYRRCVAHKDSSPT